MRIELNAISSMLTFAIVCVYTPNDMGLRWQRLGSGFDVWLVEKKKGKQQQKTKKTQVILNAARQIENTTVIM